MSRSVVTVRRERKELERAGVSLLVSQLQYCLEDEEAVVMVGFGLRRRDRAAVRT